MIPILYGSIEVLFANANDDIFQQTSGELFSTQEQVMDFSTLGIGFLTDCITCTVKEVRNGEYELEMTYPATGKRFKDIKVGGVIAAVPSKGRQPDYFSIYKVTKPLSGIISVYAEHISYQLSRIPVLPFTAANVQSALQGLKTNSVEDNPFTFWTDKATVANYKQTTPASVRARLGGVQGSILDVYGGEFEFDRYDVKLWANRGADNGVQIRYGKNLTDLNQETNIANTITGVCPYWADNEGNNVVTLPEKVVRSANAGFFPYNRTVVRDFSSDFEEKPTQDQLRAAAVKYVNQSGVGVPDVSTKVSFVDLSTADDYADLALLETVKLCDIVTVIFEPYDVQVRAKVTETIWNVLKDRYDSVTLGNATTKLSSVVASSDKAVTEEIQAAKSSLAHAIDTVTEQITGVNGGYVRFNYDANDNPYELLIMNTPDIDTATRVWRWNQNGLGVSNNGYEGPFELAMTADGHFVADFITAGTLNANDVTISNLTVGMINGSISGSDGWGIDFTNGTMNIGTLAVSKITGTQSLGNNWSIDFDNGTMTIGNLSANNINTGTLTAIAINNGNGTFSVDENGNLVATSGSIGGFVLASSSISSDDPNVNLYFGKNTRTYTITPAQSPDIANEIGEEILYNRLLTYEDVDRYDLNADGEIDSLDLALASNPASTGNTLTYSYDYWAVVEPSTDNKIIRLYKEAHTASPQNYTAETILGGGEIKTDYFFAKEIVLRNYSSSGTPTGAVLVTSGASYTSSPQIQLRDGSDNVLVGVSYSGVEVRENNIVMTSIGRGTLNTYDSSGNSLISISSNIYFATTGVTIRPVVVATW